MNDIIKPLQQLPQLLNGVKDCSSRVQTLEQCLEILKDSDGYLVEVQNLLKEELKLAKEFEISTVNSTFSFIEYCVGYNVREVENVL